jgi:cellulose synthase operon protein C
MVKLDGNTCPKLLLLVCCALVVCLSKPLFAQSAAEKVLLAKAQSLVANGHLELAVQTWQQVLLSDPTNRDAFLGIAKADMQLGKTEEAQKYAQRLRELGGSSADLAQIEAMPHVQPPLVRLNDARRSAQRGDYADAMKIYRDLFPNGPPAGDMSLEFYETEAAIPESRRQATDELRKLSTQFSADPRYAIALGRILTYDPKTRAQGIALLSHFDSSPEAQEALKQASSWNSDAKRAADSSITLPATSRAPGAMTSSTNPSPAKELSRDPMEGSAYRALNGGRLDEAEQQFAALLAKEPHNAQALSGMGYVLMKRGNFADAQDYLEKARAAGAPKLEGVISTARFWSRMAQAGSEQKSGDAQAAAEDYRNALSLKPTNSDAEEALAGALMQAGNHADAVGILKREVATNPENDAAWRNLFLAQAQMGDWRETLATSQKMPKNVEARLETDPDYLRFLIQGYLATGRKSEADRATDRALSLPLPNHGRDLPIDKQMQFAALLMTVRRFEPALSLYRQVLDVDPENAGAWRALVGAEHQLDRDDDVFATIRSMPRSAYEENQKDSGFLALLGSIYQSRNQLSNAEKYLEKALVVAGSPQPGIELQLADLYVAQGELQKAYSIYRRELDRDPNSPDAWRGLLTTLHQSKRDLEALREVDAMPDSARLALEKNPSYLETLASIEDATGQTKAALQTFELISQVYLDRQVDEPADVQIQYGWLLLNSGDDRRLYSLVSKLAETPDLTAEQKTNLNKMWAAWSVRRANSALAGGDLQRAIVLLETAAQAFPGNADVYNALAGAYLKAGEPKRAVAIYASVDLGPATLAQYEGAIGAALAAHDLKHAETWLQTALNLYKHDPTILKMAAQYEQAKGDAGRAAAYYRAALDAMGPQYSENAVSQTTNQTGDSGDPERGNVPGRELLRLLAPPGSTDQKTEDDPGRGKVEREADVSRETPRAKVTTLGEFDSSGGDDGDETSSSLKRDDAPVHDPDYSPRYQVPDGVSSRGSRAAPIGRYVQYPSRKSRSSLEDRTDANNVVPGAPSSGDSAPVDDLQDAAVRYPSRERQPAIESRRYTTIVPATPSLGDLSGAQDPPDAVPPPSEPSMRASLSELPTGRAYVEVQDTQASEQSSPGGRKSRGSNPVPADNTSDSGPAEKLQDTVKNMKAPPRSQERLPSIDNGDLLDRNELSSNEKDPGNNISDPPLSAGEASTQVVSPALPPLTGPIVANPAPLTPREQIQQQLAELEGASSNWVGGTSTLNYRSGQPGYDLLSIYSAQAEASGMLGSGVRTTFIVKPVLLDSGQATGTDTIQQGTLPLTSTPSVQTAAGTAGEVQLQTANFGARIGTTPIGFLIHNYTGGLSIHPVSAHFSLDFSRDPVLDTQLSYAGLRDEGSVTPTFAGNTWGGVIADSGEIQIHSGDALSGWYVQGGGQYLTGLHVANNQRIDGDGGAYWTAWHSSEYGNLVVGMNFFGMHYERNLRYFTYGQGGYFSPGAYMLAAVPLTFNGHKGPKFHYRIVGSLGIQAFQEDSTPFFPLDPVYEAAQGNPSYHERTSVGGNYNLETEASYTIADHWYVGAYANFNNSRDYASDTIAFFVRFLSRSQPINQESGPTGLFPTQGMRPLKTP